MKLYLYYFLFSLVFYSQNFFFSLFSAFVFVPSLSEFITLYLLVLIISKSSYSKFIFSIWSSLYLIHFSFISFFGREIASSDIYLFFTHIVETYETFSYTLDRYIGVFILFLFLICLIFWIDFKKIKANIYILLFLLVSVLFIGKQTNDASFVLVNSLKDLSFLDTKTVELREGKKLEPLRNSDVNIVLVIGESMRAKEYQDKEYEMFERYFYKTIYSGATSTDVSLPLLLNGAIKPSSIEMGKNLFILAKQNNFYTTFITAQTPHSMKYIKPYLFLKNIDDFRVLGTRDDMNLVDELQKMDNNHSNLFVLQMQGEHSPYKYYPNFKDIDLNERYTQSMNYSNKIIMQMIAHIKKIDKRTIFIFTSDHGELLGEGSMYGHNTFEEQVYRVPLIIVDNFNSDVLYEDIFSHNDVYTLIYHSLGYSKILKYSQETLRVNGSMINEEDGYKLF